MRHEAHGRALKDGERGDNISALLAQRQHLIGADNAGFTCALRNQLRHGCTRRPFDNFNIKTLRLEQPILRSGVNAPKFRLWNPIQLQSNFGRAGCGITAVAVGRM